MFYEQCGLLSLVVQHWSEFSHKDPCKRVTPLAGLSGGLMRTRWKRYELPLSGIVIICVHLCLVLSIHSPCASVCVNSLPTLCVVTIVDVLHCFPCIVTSLPLRSYSLLSQLRTSTISEVHRFVAKSHLSLLLCDLEMVQRIATQSMLLIKHVS